jgi:hypothetical protein
MSSTVECHGSGNAGQLELKACAREVVQKEAELKRIWADVCGFPGRAGGPRGVRSKCVVVSYRFKIMGLYPEE